MIEVKAIGCSLDALAKNSRLVEILYDFKSNFAAHPIVAAEDGV